MMENKTSNTPVSHEETEYGIPFISFAVMALMTVATGIAIVWFTPFSVFAVGFLTFAGLDAGGVFLKWFWVDRREGVSLDTFLTDPDILRDLALTFVIGIGGFSAVTILF